MTAVSKQDLENLTLRFAVSVDVKDDLHEVYIDDTGRRHEIQRDRLDKALTDETVDPSAFRTYEYKGQRRCLFNILVALEWSPSRLYLEALKEAFQQASRLLIDVTDGFMAIGQVAVGGPELMNCADIQIFASNRLFPRASVNGLNDPTKYQPIRVGRGLWSKNARTTIPWDDRRGYATLVHEWGHYALGLKDQYLTLEASSGYVTPDRSLVKDTIMANLDKSELLSPRPNRQDAGEDSEWEALRRHPAFTWLQIEPGYQRKTEPPAEMATPTFRVTGAASGDSQELLFALNGAGAGGRAMSPSHCWVYIVKRSLADPAGLIAQGSYEQTGDFRLLGANTGDFVVLIGDQQGEPGRPLVLWAQIDDDDRGSAQIGEWHDATPEPFPIVHVKATSPNTAPPFGLKLPGLDHTEWDAFVFPLGREPKPANEPVGELDVLDGHVMLVSKGAGDKRLAIACYAQGGSPFSGYPGHPNPIPAGSADGNAMLFFYDDKAEPLSYRKLYEDAPPPPAPFNASNIIVATSLENDARSPDGWEPRGYTFSITSYGSLEEVAHLHPTLVLYFDEATRQSTNGKLIIARYEPKAQPAWKELTDSTVNLADYFVAASLGDDLAAPRLFKSEPEPEQFRLFLVKP
jgi:hypothetical protein